MRNQASERVGDGVAQADAAAPPVVSAPPVRRERHMVQELMLIGVLIVLLIIFGALNSSFVSQSSLISTAQDSTEVAILAIGELYVIIAAGIDLSIGAILGLAGVIAAMVTRDITASPALALFVGGVVAIAIGLACGLANGLMIVKLRITPFVATLAMLGIATGLTLVLTSGVDVSGLPPLAVSAGSSVFLRVLTMPIVVAIVLAVLFGFILHKGVFGRWTYGVGSSVRAARQSGIDVRRHLVKVYMLSGLLAGIAGFVVMTRLGVGSPIEGDNDELNAITAVVIGGASLTGGRGSMLGTITGAVILSVLLSGLIIVGVQPYWQTVATGLLLAAAVVIQTIGRRNTSEDEI